MADGDLSLIEAVERFSSETAAEEWFIARRWPDGVKCPHCTSADIAVRENRKPMPFHCRKCRQYFSVRTGTLATRQQTAPCGSGRWPST